MINTFHFVQEKMLDVKYVAGVLSLVYLSLECHSCYNLSFLLLLVIPVTSNSFNYQLNSSKSVLRFFFKEKKKKQKRKRLRVTSSSDFCFPKWPILKKSTFITFWGV